MQEQYFPGSEFNVNDRSNIPVALPSGITCVQGVTLRGEPNKPIFVANWPQFEEEFGGLIAGYQFPLLCKRALDNGAKLYVSRVAHYTDLTDLDTIEGTAATASLTVSTDDVDLVAKAVGTGYNGIVFTAKAAESGIANRVDIIVKAGSYSQNLVDIVAAPNPTELETLNQRLKWVRILNITGKIPVGSATLTGGAQDLADIVDADYIGDDSTDTGWFAFDEIFDAFRIVNLDRPSPAVDAALANYAKQRGDVRFAIRVPLNSTLQDLEDYRMGTGIYSHSPIDTWLGSLYSGDISVKDPNDFNRKMTISALGDLIGLRSVKDEAVGEWIAAAGYDYGRVRDNLGLVGVNLGKARLKQQAKRIYAKGVNSVIKHQSFGTVLWGNRTLQLDQSSLLSRDNIADLVMFILRSLPQFVDRNNFRPNDPKSWSGLYRSVKPFVRDLETGRAIRPGEGTNWFWLGDQNASSLDELQINTKSAIDAGRYKAIFRFVPIGAMEFIEISVEPTDSETIVQLVQQ